MENIILNTDSYKASHWLQMPPGSEYQNSYIESRGGKWNRSVFFGLQAFIKQYLSKPVTLEMQEEAEEIITAHGEPFNKEGWDLLRRRYDGYLPLVVEAVPEGTVVPNSNVLVQVRNTDPDFYWLTSYVETALLRAVWYATTVATNSFMAKEAIYQNLIETSDDPDGQVMFKLHDFGARGASSFETAMIGGAAHLVNFMGTDTISGLVGARRWYNEAMAGFSIPAAEHSTITTWDSEEEAFRNMLKQFAKEGSLVAVVSDSYNIYNATENLWGDKLKEEVLKSGATVVVRPDSGDPVQVPVDVVSILGEKYGFTVNSKGFKVLNPAVRVIQGDGINYDSLKEILANMKANGWSMDNLAFGMGAGLLQQVDRDTLKFAMKCSAVRINGTWRDVSKAPVGDTSKTSKAGLLGLFTDSANNIITRRIDQGWDNRGNMLREVFRDGNILVDEDFSVIRERATEGLQLVR